MSRTKFMGIFLIILGVISVVVGIVRGDMTSSAAMFIGYLVPALLGAMILAPRCSSAISCRRCSAP